jgi:putative restriction endonuclease
MSLEDTDDALLRRAAFDHVRALQERHDALTSEHLKAGFPWQSQRIPLVNPQRGIFKPRSMRYLLSIRTVYPRAGNRIWYDDQRQVQQQLYAGDESVDYAFMGTDADAADNRWLREAWEQQIPLLYFLGVSPGRYHAIVPGFIADWDRQGLKARVAFGLPGEQRLVGETAERRYALRLVKQRLHQASFRDAVISAYQGRCALSGLPEPILLDAAHIIADSQQDWGQPVVPNGIPLSKIHHAAFDAHLIGIDPDYFVHVAERLRSQNDGPMLEALKRLQGSRLHLPQRSRDQPDRDRLAMRFEEFRAAA